MKFYGRHSMTSKYQYYLHRLLLYTVLLSLTLSLLHFLGYLHLVLFCMDGGLIHQVIVKLSFKIKSFYFL